MKEKDFAGKNVRMHHEQAHRTFMQLYETFQDNYYLPRKLPEGVYSPHELILLLERALFEFQIVIWGPSVDK